MSVHVIDTIKPKNNGTFPVVEAADVAVSDSQRLPAALASKANATDLAETNAAVALKASQTDLTALSETVSGKASQTDLTALSETVATKAAATDLAETNATVATKADSTALEATNSVVATKANASDVATADANLQAQIDNIVGGSTEDAEVINARVGADGTSYTTLKARLDAENNFISNSISQFGAKEASYNDKIKTSVSGGTIELEYDHALNAYHVEGSSSSFWFSNRMEFSNNEFPDYIHKGGINYISYESTDSNIYLEIYIKRGSGSYEKYQAVNANTDKALYLPADLTGLIARLAVNANSAVDGYANVAFTSEPTNECLNRMALTSSETALPSCNLNDITGNNIYLLSSSETYTNSPLEIGMLTTYELANAWRIQILQALDGNNIYKRTRSGVSSQWTNWILIEAAYENSLGSATDKTLSQNYITLNASGFARSAAEYTHVVDGTTTIALSDINKPGYYIISDTWTVTDAPYGVIPTGVKVEKYSTGNSTSFLKQTIENVASNVGVYAYYRYSNVSGVYQDWKPCGREGFAYAEPQALADGTDLNDLTTNSSWLMASGRTYGNAPFYDSSGESVGVLMQSIVSGWRFQIWFSFSSADVYKRFGRADLGWRGWTKINGTGGGSEIIYNVTQNINRDNFTNTYNITTTPTITTDDNGWLQAVDSNTESETGKTDMSAAILSMLNDTGYCHLAPGIFYVSGFDMPAGATLEGCGKKTIIRLLSSVSSGYAVRIGQNNTVKNICFSGGYSKPSDCTTEGADLGSRHGVYCVANADGQESAATPTITNIVTDCFFENFDGSAFYNHNTGYGLDSVVIMSSCRIVDSKVGINIDYFGEYSKYSDIIISGCNHACINNGGNNVFTACTFHGVVGFLIDNTADDKRNNAHGSAIGCIFNHLNNMNNPSELGMGDAIVVKGAANGFIFSECQLWYGAVKIINSKGVAVQNSLFGGNSPHITVSGSFPAFFMNNVFMASPTLTLNAGTKFNNCYLAATGAPIINQ